ncbi:hypothetical protein ACFXJ8_28550 [Nonomuraea sp. NPDC059194]|uniref:hypothetical protein n=1 Tax=Nonomuraea sp. NPDC059194 TaxID=3346764 RepID=UPI003688BEF9
MRQPAGEAMTTETTGTSAASKAAEVEESDVSEEPEFDPDATGVIPRITVPKDDPAAPRTDARQPEAESPETVAPEAESSQAGSPEAGSPQAGSPQAGSPQAGSPQEESPREGRAAEEGSPSTDDEPEAAADDVTQDSQARAPECADEDTAESPASSPESVDDEGTPESTTPRALESADEDTASQALESAEEGTRESAAPETPESADEARDDDPEIADEVTQETAFPHEAEADSDQTNPALRLPEREPEPDDSTEITQAVRLPPRPQTEEQAEKQARAADEAADSTVATRVPTPFSSVQVGRPPEAPENPAAPASPATSAAPAAPAAPAVPKRKPAAPAHGWGARLTALAQGAPRWLPVLLVLEGLVMYVLALRVPPGPLRGVDPADIGGLGLISAMPLSAFFAIILMIVSFFVTVTQSTDRKFLLLFQIAAITFALHGAGAIVADAPRFPTAYVHAGFVDFISRTGETAISLDARMAWPGFFALFAFVGKAAGITDFTPILNWTPLLSNLLYLLPFVLILRQVVATTRARWFAALLFILVQWIGQDYFSPQGFTFALYLAFVAILLRWFGKVEARSKPLPAKGPVRRLLARLDAMLPGELAYTGTFRADKLLMLMLLIALFFAATASHQITPFMMLGVLTAFLLVKRTSLTWALPFFFGLVVLAWISYQTVGFWQGNMEAIFGGIGRLLENLQRGTGDRIAGSDPVHALVLKTRLGICAAVLLLAAAGLVRRLRRGVFDRAALVLLCVPVLAMGLQSYGGEMGLRVYMFMLPGACLLAAYAFFPNLPADSEDASEETVPFRQRNVRFNPRTTRIISIVLAACVALALSMAFLIARYGNEKFERVTAGEVAAMRYVYEHDKPSARVLYLVPKLGPEVTPILPWGERDFEKVDFTQQALVHKDPTTIKDVVDKLRSSERNTFLAVTKGQAAYLQLNEGFPADWYPKFVAALDKSKEIKKVYSNEDSALYTWKKFVKGTEIPDPRYASGGPGDPGSPWSVVGVIALALTWLALFSYEVIRLHGRDKAPRARRRLLWVAIPAFVIAIAVIVERFLYIGLNMFR